MKLKGRRERKWRKEKSESIKKRQKNKKKFRPKRREKLKNLLHKNPSSALFVLIKLNGNRIKNKIKTKSIRQKCTFNKPNNNKGMKKKLRPRKMKSRLKNQFSHLSPTIDF